MLHPRHHFLADKAALLEVDAAELIHVGLVRKGVAIGEIDTAMGHAERDPVRVVSGGIGELGAKLGRGLRRRGRAE